MSAAISSNEVKSNVVNFKSSARRNFLQYLVKLSTIESDLVSDLSAQSDVEILETRRNAEKLGKAQWRIEIACDAELVSRSEKKVGGRGHKDEDGTGRMSAIVDRAHDIGCTPATVKKNIQIFNLMQSAESKISDYPTLEILDEKGFFLTALSAVDPLTAVKTFVEKKIETPSFKVTDAAGYLEQNNLTQKQAKEQAENRARAESGKLTIREKETALLDKSKKFILDLLSDCPSARLEKMLKGWLAEIANDSENESDEDMSAALIKAWDLGHHREDQMSEHTGIPLVTVTRLMRMLDETGDDFIPVPRPGEFKTWHKVGEPLPIELRGGTKSIDDIRYDRGDF